MYTDRFILTDANGEVIVEKMMAQHIKAYIDETYPDTDRNFKIKSLVSGYEMAITNETTAEDWHNYADGCLMALD